MVQKFSPISSGWSHGGTHMAEEVVGSYILIHYQREEGGVNWTWHGILKLKSTPDDILPATIPCSPE